VVLESSADTAVVASSVHGRIHHTYARGFKGLAVEISDADAQALARDPRVQFVEEDATVSTASTHGPRSRRSALSPSERSYVSSETGAA